MSFSYNSGIKYKELKKNHVITLIRYEISTNFKDYYQISSTHSLYTHIYNSLSNTPLYRIIKVDKILIK